ncbi:hypothetical protein AAHH17_08275 [Lysinibacillus capsici]|uniref:hypothetical protein n=1 Tax=Lysinibacillus capsici TaxID=2115968 RepID=UPI0032E3A1EF
MSKDYKIIKIINEFELVVNAGKNAGITREQTLEVFVPGEEVKDPFTGEILGNLDFIKAYLTVKDVYDKMCICENKARTTSILTTSAWGFNEPLRLNVNSKDISGGINSDKKIYIGDLVRKS